ncbi:hypothetical protein G5I_00160 [Acromyrmex echinatior]|uniref:Uncharacterized protein n=1 Tax=Acromyrmex echinatior TaxID=103372 RepID=F4W455_ACREC|nr:hypothetical protein G5I_00160 [Acromyrmex echinatior]
MAFRHAPAHVVRLSGRMILLKLLGHVQDAETRAYTDPNLDSCPRGKRGNESRSQYLFRDDRYNVGSQFHGLDEEFRRSIVGKYCPSALKGETMTGEKGRNVPLPRLEALRGAYGEIENGIIPARVCFSIPHPCNSFLLRRSNLQARAVAAAARKWSISSLKGVERLSVRTTLADSYRVQQPDSAYKSQGRIYTIGCRLSGQ